MDKFVLENYDPALVNLYSRIESINDITDIYNLIPDDHKIIDPLPSDVKKEILYIISQYEPTVDFIPKIKRPDLNVLQKISELRTEFTNDINKYNTSKDDYQHQVSSGFPIVFNSRRFLLSNFFDIEYNDTYVSHLTRPKYGVLLLNVIVNTLIKHDIDIYGENIGINVHIHQLINAISEEKQDEVIQNLKALIASKTIRSHDDLYKFFTFILDECLQSRNIDEYLLANGYKDLQSLVDGSCCRIKTLFNQDCRDRSICFKYIDEILLPNLRTLKPFKIENENIQTAQLFLHAFPYIGTHYVHIEYIDGEAYTKFSEKHFGQYDNAIMSEQTKTKFISLLNVISFEMPYQVIYDLTRVVKFDVHECISLFNYVLDFKNYICAFLSSLLCHHNLNIFDGVDTKLQYQLLKCLPNKYHITYQTNICKYNPPDIHVIDLSIVYKTFEFNNIAMNDFDTFVALVNELKDIATSRAELVIICSQIVKHELYVYEYLSRFTSIDALTTFILIRILLANPQISNSEKNLLHYMSNNIYTLFNKQSNNFIGFPNTLLSTGRYFTKYDLITLDEYFKDFSNSGDIPLVAEDVSLNDLSKFLTRF